MANIFNQRLGVPVQWTPPSSSGSATTLAMNSANTKWAVIFKPEDLSVALRYLGFTVSSTTGTPPTYQISIQTVDASCNPTGTIVGGGTPCSQTFTPPGPSSWNNTHQKIDVGSGNAFTPSAATLYAMVIEYSSGTIDASNMMTLVAGQGQLGSRFGFIHYRTSTDGGSTWTKQSSGAGIPPFSYAGDTSRTYGLPYATFFTSQFSSNTAAASGGDERGGKFTFAPSESGTYEIAGVEFLGRMGAAGGTFDVTLYEGTTVRKSLTLDTDAFQGIADYQVFSIPFDSVYEGSFGTAYILAVKSNNTGQNIAVFGIEVASAADRAAFGFGSNGQWVSREDAGAWDESNTTRVACVWPIVTAITPSGGGSGGTIIKKRGQAMDLRQSTASTVPFGQFLDTSGNPVTSLTIQKADVRLKKAGGDAAAASADQGTSDAGAPHDENGFYDGALNATDLNTVGPLLVFINKAGAVTWEGTFNVLTAEEYDAKYSTGARRANVTQWRGNTPANLADTDKVPASAQHMAANVLTASAIAADALTAAKIAADVTTEIQAGLATGTSITALADKILAYFQLALRKDAAIAADRSTELAEINGNEGSGPGDYASTSDSQQAIIDGAATVAEVGTEMQAVLENNHLDHLLAVAYDPSSKPGAADALLNELVESDAGVSRFTANALEQAPSGGGGGSSDWTTGEKEQIRHRLGIDGTASAPSATPSLATAAALATVDSNVDEILLDTGTTLPASLAALDAKLDTIVGYLDTEIAAIISSLATITGLIDTEIASILADTNELQMAWADGGRLDLLLDAIKAVTDLIPNGGAMTSIAQEATLTSTGRGDPSALGAPLPSTLSMASKIDWILARVLRENSFNKTAGEEIIRNAAGTPIAKATAADDGVTSTRSAFGAP